MQHQLLIDRFYKRLTAYNSLISSKRTHIDYCHTLIFNYYLFHREVYKSCQNMWEYIFLILKFLPFLHKYITKVMFEWHYFVLRKFTVAEQQHTALNLNFAPNIFNFFFLMPEINVYKIGKGSLSKIFPMNFPFVTKILQKSFR